LAKGGRKWLVWGWVNRRVKHIQLLQDGLSRVKLLIVKSLAVEILLLKKDLIIQKYNIISK
jgi:hypothetical protein